MLFTRTSIISGITRTIDIPVTNEEMRNLAVRADLIQNILPNLTADQREFLMTGITPEEWDAAFPPPGDEDEDDDDGDDGDEGDPWGYPEDGGLEYRDE